MLELAHEGLATGRFTDVHAGLLYTGIERKLLKKSMLNMN